MTSDVERIWKKLSELDERLTAVEEMLHSKTFNTSNNPLRDWVLKQNIPYDKVIDLYEIEEDRITVLQVPPEKRQRNRVLNIAILTIFGYSLLKNQQYVPSKELHRNVEAHGISSKNFWRDIKGAIPKLIQRKGNSRRTNYSLTINGRKEAIKLIKNIINVTKER